MTYAIVRSDRNADNGDWCFLTPEREQDLADLVTAEGGIASRRFRNCGKPSAYIVYTVLITTSPAIDDGMPS